MKPGNATGAAADEALWRARQALQSHPAEAERLAAEFLDRKPGDAKAAKILASALFAMGRNRDVIAPLEKAARSNRDPECETLLAIALRKTGDRDGALLWLKRAIKRKPAFPAAFHELGFVYGTMHRFDDAIATLRRGIAAAPMMTELYVQLGSIYQSVNDSANARAAFEQALAINPNNPEAIHGLGAALIERRDFEAAAELFKREVMANPADAQARINLGNCLLALGQHDAAFACLRAASARGPKAYGRALKVSVGSARGRFWLRPSAAAKFFKDDRS